MANTEWAFPFADNNGDRMYSDTDFAKFFSAWFVNGIFINVGSGLQLVDSVAGGMRITLKSGAANINGRVYYLNTDTDFTVPVASPVQDRTDSVTVKLDITNRTMNVIYKQGDTSVTRNDSVYELQIATIFVAKNISEITQSMISDMRTNKSVCGLASPNDPIDVDSFITQFKALFDKQLTDNGNAFTDWFDNLKNELDSNQATNLQNQITTNKNDIKINTDNINTLLAKTPVSLWAENTDYKFGDLVTFNSLGSAESGLLTNPVFMCISNHTSSTMFPDSTNNVWQLVNETSYYYENTITPAGVIGMILKRCGKTVQIVTTSGTTGNLLSYSNQWVNLAGKVPSGFTPSSNTDVSASISQIQNMWVWRFNVDNSIQLRQNWGSNTTLGKGNYFAMTGVWITQDDPVWLAGTPT